MNESFEQRMQRIEQLIEWFDASADPAAQSAARDLVQALLDLHATALRRLLDNLAQSGDQASAALADCYREPLIRSVLVLHDLHPEGIEARVRQALQQVQPLLESHGGGVELLAASPDQVRIRLLGNCQGCPSSAATLHSLVETAVRNAAPEVEQIEVEAPSAHQPGSLVQIELAGAKQLSATR